MHLLYLLTLVVICSISIQATTILVPSEQPTIQAGIDAASEGDTVLVAPGTYTGDGNRDLNFNGVNLVLKSESGAELTIVDCESNSLESYAAIYLDNGEDTTSVIDGFTFKRGYYTEWPIFGIGALYFKNGKANVINCIITDNSEIGIYLTSDNDTNSCRISNCLIENNGTGIYTLKRGTVIEDCIIQNNLWSGIGFYNTTLIKRCLIVHNGWTGVSQASGMGGHLFQIDHCTIAYNGIGVYLDRTLPKVNTITLATDTSSISNTLVAFNTNGGIYNFYDLEEEYNCTYSNVFGNGNYNWQNDKYAAYDQFGNLSLNPLFCDVAVGDYYVTEFSRCASVNNSSGSTIGLHDIGCTCCRGIRGNVDGDHDEQIDISDLVYLVDCIFLDCFTVCEEEIDMNASGQYDISDLVYLVDFIFMGGPEPLPCN